MRPAIWTDAFVEWEAEQALDALAACGWRTLELAEVHWRRLAERDQPERHARELRRRADGLGVAFAQMHGLTYDFWAEGADVPEGLARSRRALGLAALLGVRQYVFHPCSGSWSTGAAAQEAHRQRSREVVGELAAAGRAAGVGIAVENMPGPLGGRRWFGATPAQLLWLVEQTDPEAVGVCWDTGHGHIAGLDPAAAVTALGPHLSATHIQDSDGTADQHRLPYEGTLDWAALLGGLRRVGYRGAFTLEVGGAVHRTPLALRPAKLRFALELATAMAEGAV